MKEKREKELSKLIFKVRPSKKEYMKKWRASKHIPLRPAIQEVRKLKLKCSLCKKKATAFINKKEVCGFHFNLEKNKQKELENV